MIDKEFKFNSQFACLYIFRLVHDGQSTNAYTVFSQQEPPVKASISVVDLLAFTGDACPGDYGSFMNTIMDEHVRVQQCIFFLCTELRFHIMNSVPKFVAKNNEFVENSKLNQI